MNEFDILYRSIGILKQIERIGELGNNPRLPEQSKASTQFNP